jgi:hypothetical protein
MQISNTGQVLFVLDCAGVTTTTTTTTLATTYYDAKELNSLCAKVDTTSVLKYVGSTSYAVDDIVKADDGLCYQITGVSVSTTEDAEIYFQYSTCDECKA